MEAEVKLRERFLFLLLVGFVFQRLLLLSVRQRPDNLLNAIPLEEERGRRSNLSDESRRGRDSG
jgi:hypothetical protein